MELLIASSAISFVLQINAIFSMKPGLLIIFSLLLVNLHAQISDDFSDGDFTNNPPWTGTANSFLVNTDLQLQLNAPAAGEAILITPLTGTISGNTEWHFFIQHDFASSTSNYSRFYLSSDQSDLNQPLNGYYLQFGESLSNDAIELFRQDGTTITSVCRATTGLIANSFSMNVKIIRDGNADWKLYVDYSGGSNYQLEANGNDATYSISQFTGMHFVFTSGNINKFYFDNFYFGPEILDTIAPGVSNIETTSDSSLTILFSESMDITTVTNGVNYSCDNGIGSPYLITRDSASGFQYQLFFNNKFQSGQEYHLNISHVADIAQNELLNSVSIFNYTAFAIALPDDVIITEVYFAPSADSPLPNAEYIEIFNRKDSAIKLDNWIISDGSSDGELVSISLNPHEFALLFDAANAQLFSSYANAFPVNDFPTLNNSGDNIRLIDVNGSVINELNFTTDYYGDNGKDDGGWSVERKDVDFTCVNSANWKASVASLHGTPGIVNSIAQPFKDESSPYFTNAYLLDSITLVILFSETVSTDASDPANYKITSKDGTQIVIQNINFENDSVALTFADPIPASIYTLQGSVNIHDCPGNQLQTFYKKQFGYPSNAIKGDIIINEVLFYCNSGATDYVEVYNSSDKIIDLKDWFISETDTSFTEVKETSKISSSNKLIFPGEYLVLSADEKMVCEFYKCENPKSFLNLYSMPDLSSEEGGIIINDNAGNRITEFAYSDEMHFPILSDTRGVSLERLSFKNENNNWHSAARTAGFGTPGYVNSLTVGLSLGDGRFSLNAEVFSPDGDGYCDVLAVHYRCEEPGTVLSLNVFNLSGKLVRKVLDHQTVNMEGDLFWDGLNDKHEELCAGMYVILVESYDLKGKRQTYKNGVYLTRKGE